MQFTTTTEIARKGSKIFQVHNEAVVLSNNKPVGALLSYKIYEKLKESGYLDEIKDSIKTENKDYLCGLSKNLEEWNEDINNDLFA